MSARVGVIGLYRQLLRHASDLRNTEKRLQALTQIREEFRKNAQVTSEKEVAALLERGAGKLGWLRIASPRRGRVSSEALASRSQRFVLRDGEILEGESGRVRADFVDMRLDPDDIARHNRLVQRQRFIGRDKPLRIKSGGEGKILPYSE